MNMPIGKCIGVTPATPPLGLAYAERFAYVPDKFTYKLRITHKNTYIDSLNLGIKGNWVESLLATKWQPPSKHTEKMYDLPFEFPPPVETYYLFPMIELVMKDVHS